MMMGKGIRRMAAAWMAALVLAGAGGCAKTADAPKEDQERVFAGQETGIRDASEEGEEKAIAGGKKEETQVRQEEEQVKQEEEQIKQEEGQAEQGEEQIKQEEGQAKQEEEQVKQEEGQVKQEGMQAEQGGTPGDESGGFPERESPAYAQGFVVLAEEVPDIVQEIRYYSTYNFVGQRIDGYEKPCALLTEEAASALKKVSDDVMEQGYRLKVYDAYRPQMAVDHFVRWAKDQEDTRMKPYFYPEVEKSRLFEEGYISARSGHSRGSTIDLTLLDMETGKEADMGGVFDYFGKRSHSDYVGNLTAEQQKNRRILREAMLRHGFKAISTEWWHYTLKEEPYPDTYFDFPVN